MGGASLSRALALSAESGLRFSHHLPGEEKGDRDELVLWLWQLLLDFFYNQPCGVIPLGIQCLLLIRA